jgi:peptidoglycan/LPS O-acetylase OafA/YrhL
LVVFYHAGIFGFRLPGNIQRFGWIGVDLFFVLSGYLIAGQLLRPIRRDQSPNLFLFFWRRALRILPAYLVVLAVYFFLPDLREFPDIPPAWKFLGFVQNIGLRGGTAFSHAWSLCIEAQFYLVLPFVLLLVARWKRGGIAVAIVVLVAGVFLRAAIAWFISADGAVPFRGFQRFIYYPTWPRLDPLTLGACLAAIEQFRTRWWTKLVSTALWLWLLALGLIVYALYLGERDELTVSMCIWQFPLIAFGMAGFLICAVSPRLPFARIAVPGAAFIASIAYSTYLSHKLAIHWIEGICKERGIAPSSAIAICMVLGAIAIVGTTLFFAVERPFLQLRQRRTIFRPKMAAATTD